MNNQLSESFDLDKTLPYSKLTPINTKGLLSDFFKSVYSIDDDMLDDVLKNIKNGYLISEKDEILLFTVENSDSVEYHFINLTQKIDRGQTNSLGKTSTILFSTIIKIILDNLNTAKEVHIRTEENRVKLYSKIMKVVLSKHAPNWEVKEIEKVMDGVKNIILKSKRLSSPLFERLFRK